MFAFSQVDDRTQGQVANLDIGLDQYLSNAWESGLQNSMFASVYHYNELGIEKDGSSMFGLLKWDTGKKLDPNEATQKYGMPGLSFSEPINEGAARMMHDRHMAETYRDVIASQGNQSLFSGRTLLGMGTQMIASTLNPLDLGTMFIPWTGSEKAMAAAGKMGLGRVSQGLARGLITHEALSALPTPRLIESLIHGVGFQALYEIPNVMSKFQNNEENPFESIPGDIITQAGFAGALHGVSRILGLLSPQTHEYMMRKAVDDLMKGNNVQVDGVAKMEPTAEAVHLLEQDGQNGEVPQDAAGFERFVDRVANAIKKGRPVDILRGGEPVIGLDRLKGMYIEQIKNVLAGMEITPENLHTIANAENPTEAQQIAIKIHPDPNTATSEVDPTKLENFRTQAVKDFAQQSRIKKVDITPINNHPELPSVDLRDNGNGPKTEEINQQIADLRQELGEHAEEVEKPEKPAKDPHQTAIDCILRIKS